MIKEIIELLKSSETALAPSTVYRAKIASIDLGAAAAEVDACASRRDAVLLKGSEEDAAKADQDLAVAARAHDRLRLAVAELERLAAQAEAAEKGAVLEAAASGAHEAQRAALAAYVEMHEIAARLAKLLADVEASEQTIRDANILVTKSDRRDLRTALPLDLLARHIGREAGSITPIHKSWTLAGYHPEASQHPPYAHFRELLPSRSRKAA